MKTFVTVIISTSAMILLGVIAFVIIMDPESYIPDSEQQVSVPVKAVATAVVPNTKTSSVSEYISKVEIIRKSLAENSNSFYQTELDYLSRKLNQQQALEQFNKYFSLFEKTVKTELIPLKIQPSDPAYNTNQELLKVTEEYYNHMVKKIDWTTKGTERSVTATKRINENLHNFESELRDLKDLQEGK